MLADPGQTWETDPNPYGRGGVLIVRSSDRPCLMVLHAQTQTVGTCVPTVMLLDVLQMHSYSEYTSLAQKVQWKEAARSPEAEFPRSSNRNPSTERAVMRVAKCLVIVSVGIGALAVGLPLGQMAYAEQGGTPSSLPGAMPTKDLSGYANTYWYVPTQYLPSYQYSTKTSPKVMEVPDQTVWHFTTTGNGYLHGCSYRSVGTTRC